MKTSIKYLRSTCHDNIVWFDAGFSCLRCCGATIENGGHSCERFCENVYIIKNGKRTGPFKVNTLDIEEYPEVVIDPNPPKTSLWD